MTPSAVLFACDRNLVRSPMAAALMRRRYQAAVFVDSCGLRVTPSDQVDPFCVAVMDELGLDISDHRPKSFDDLVDSSFDVVVSLSPNAHHRALELSRRQSVELEYWPTEDPTLATGSREAILDAYRRVRDSLDARIVQRFGARLSVGG
jgi:protein-tyrosine-phosphatase